MKRFISALLALCMVCSLMPATGAAEGEATGTEKSEIKVVYDWASQMNPGVDNKTINSDDFLKKYTFDRSHNLWKYDSRKGWSDYTWRGGNYIQFNRSGGGLYMIFEVYVPKTGIYTLEQKYAKFGGSKSDIAVYITSKEDFESGKYTSRTHADNKVLELDCKAESGGIATQEPATLDKYLKEGYYYVAYSQVKTAEGTNVALFGNLTLNGGDGKAVTEITEISAPAEVTKGATGTVTASVYYSDLSFGTAAPGDVTYESSNSDVLEINAATGEYTAKAGGTATVIVTAGLINKSVNMTVKNTEQSGVTVVYDWASQMNGKGDNISIHDDAFLNEFTFDRSHNLWKYDSRKSWVDYKWRGGDYIQLIKGGAGLYMAFEVYVPKSGTYTLEQKYATWGAGRGGTLAVYIIRKENGAAFVEGNMSEANKALTLNCSGTVNALVAAEPAKVAKKLEQGYYYVAYKKTNSGTDGAGDITLFGNLTLNGGTDEVDVSEPVINYVESTVHGLTEDGAIDPVCNNDGTYTLTAPETDDEKGAFLYWAKGLSVNKRIISFDNVISDYVPTENGKNYLIAVYECDIEDATTPEYYNQNGQRITDGSETVSMPGYGSTSTWKRYGDTNIYVADYSKSKTQRDNVTVTVKNGTGGGEVLFGDTVICTAAPREGQTFKCWTKTLDDDKTEVVSVDSTYTFNAWEDCTVTAVYEYTYSGSGMKIVIDSFSVTSGVTGIMAEFIGFDSNVVEKGIMFVDEDNNETKIAMTTPGKQFTVIADEAGTYKGYAIIKDDTNYKLIVDGEVTISNAE